MRFFLFILLIGIGPAAFAQSEAFVQQAGLVRTADLETVTSGSEADEALARALLDAPTASNVAVVQQRGVNNAIALIQDGTANLASVVMDGSGNQLELAQIGNENVLVGDIFGDNNSLVNSAQLGSNNSYTLFLDGVDRTTHSLMQRGDGNSAVQIVGPGLEPASIEQRGGAEVMIVRR